MKEFIFKKENLFVRILIGFILGIIAGLFFKEFAVSSGVTAIGKVYLALIKMLIIPIIFCAVSSGIINMADTGSLKRIGFKTVLVFIVLFVVVAIISLAIAYLIRPGLSLQMDTMPVFDREVTTPSVTTFLVNVFPTNIAKAFADGNILQVISFTMLFSVCILAVKEKAKPVVDFINSVSVTMFKLLDLVMETSPIGVFALMASSVGVYGAFIFQALGKYVLTCYLAVLVSFIVAMLIPVLVYTKIGAKPFLKGLGKIWMVTLSTTSSAATLPVTINVNTKDFKAPEKISNFVLPLGCTINMCGGACSFSCLAVFVADFYGMSLSLGQLVTLVVVATLINMAAPGIPGGGIVLGASFLTIMGLPFDLMGPIAAIYRLLDMAFTSMNVTGDVVANLIVSKSEGVWSGEKARIVESA